MQRCGGADVHRQPRFCTLAGIELLYRATDTRRLLLPREQWLMPGSRNDLARLQSGKVIENFAKFSER